MVIEIKAVVGSGVCWGVDREGVEGCFWDAGNTLYLARRVDYISTHIYQN